MLNKKDGLTLIFML